MSLVDFKVLEYRPSGNMVGAREELIAEITKQGLRKTMRATGLSQHTLQAILRGQAVRRATLQRVRAVAKEGLSEPISGSGLALQL